MNDIDPNQKYDALTPSEIIYYRDRLRASRYCALADAEGFHEICFAIEALGLRLHKKLKDLGTYKNELRELSTLSVSLTDLSKEHPSQFKTFDALFRIIRNARNDAMHSGIYARHATAAAIELSIGIEEALMKQATQNGDIETKVHDLMVKTPVTIESWSLVASARQLMLMHSFSFLPVKLNRKWYLLSESNLTRYIKIDPNSKEKRTDEKYILSQSIQEASASGLRLTKAELVKPSDNIYDLLTNEDYEQTRIWLVADGNNKLCGILTPFELM